MLTDTILRDGKECTATLIRAQCQRLGEKCLLPDGSPLMAKAQGCKNTPEDMRPIVFTPVWGCSLFGWAAPFADEIQDETDPTTPCGNCPKYKPLQSGISPAQTVTMKGQGATDA